MTEKGMQDSSRAAALFAQGNAFLECGDAAAAASAFRYCLALSPNHAGTFYNLGNALMAGRQRVDAVEAFIACLRLSPAFGPAYVNLAEVLRQLGFLPQAREMAEQGVRLLPDNPPAMMTLAHVLHDSTAYDDAVALYRRALELAPGHAGGLTSLGNTLRAKGQLTTALAIHDQAVAVAPDDPEIHYNRATARLMAGDFAQGWDEYEYRWQCAQSRPHGFGPAWQGEAIDGRTILLHAEQGQGDTLQFIRYAPLVAERGADVVLIVQPSLVRLLRIAMPFAKVIAQGDPVPSFDVHCPLLSLPRAFATTLESIPARVPYLRTAEADIATWAARLPLRSGLRVGLVWAGAPHHNDPGMHLIDMRRSLSPDDFGPLLDVPGVDWISLQKDVPPPAGSGMADLMPMVTDFADTAALIANLDLVVAADTAVAHLAGALGCPVWLLSRYHGCWRWLQGRDDSPWYPGMRIFRQDRPLDWAGVIRRVHTELAELAGTDCVRRPG